MDIRTLEQIVYFFILLSIICIVVVNLKSKENTKDKKLCDHNCESTCNKILPKDITEKETKNCALSVVSENTPITEETISPPREESMPSSREEITLAYKEETTRDKFMEPEKNVLESTSVESLPKEIEIKESNVEEPSSEKIELLDAKSVVKEIPDVPIARTKRPNRLESKQKTSMISYSKCKDLSCTENHENINVQKISEEKPLLVETNREKK